MKNLLALLLLSPALLFAQSPFDGTWIARLDTAQFPKKPDTYLLEKDMYECSTCVSQIQSESRRHRPESHGPSLLRHGRG